MTAPKSPREKLRRIMATVEMNTAKTTKRIREDLLGVTQGDEKFPLDEVLQIQVNVQQGVLAGPQKAASKKK
jgi:hypothetical protein